MPVPSRHPSMPEFARQPPPNAADIAGPKPAAAIVSVNSTPPA
jgi:hypothetical protein